jgi:hypothetical protein
MSFPFFERNSCLELLCEITLNALLVLREDERDLLLQEPLLVYSLS